MALNEKVIAKVELGIDRRAAGTHTPAKKREKDCIEAREHI